MTNQEIDRRLALAIGYPADRVRTQQFWHNGDYRYAVQVLNDNSRMDGPMQYGYWQRFDHTDPAVIWPIAERFNAFPVGSEWLWSACCYNDLRFWNESTSAATASALAVIKYCEAIRARN